MNGLEYLSHSRLTTFRSCPLRFKLAYVDRLKAAFVNRAALGSPSMRRSRSGSSG